MGDNRCPATGRRNAAGQFVAANGRKSGCDKIKYTELAQRSSDDAAWQRCVPLSKQIGFGYRYRQPYCAVQAAMA